MLYRSVRLANVDVQPATAGPGPSRIWIKRQSPLYQSLCKWKFSCARVGGSRTGEYEWVIGLQPRCVSRQCRSLAPIFCNVLGSKINEPLGVAPCRERFWKRVAGVKG